MSTNINPADYTILIVDDNETNIILLQAVLKRAGYNTLKANSGALALKLMQEQLPDLVLLDVMMPGMNGYETAIAKAEIDSIKDIPFLFVTALSDTESMVTGFKHGCSDFISKPFNTEEILIRIYHQITRVADKRIITNQTQELKRVIGDRDKLYAVVAHDLRSPLGTIKSVLNMLDEELDSATIGEDYYDLLHETTESADELFNLLENLLSWTKSQMGKMIFNPSQFHISEAINNAIKAASSMANIHNIALNHNDSTNDTVITADKNMITTIVRNIVVNAIKFSDDDSSIDITTSIRDNNLVCDITDHGCGMTDEIQDKLNQQISVTQTGVHSEEGTGLGLSLCRDFTKAHKGTFYFKSQIGVGSTFSFTLPLI